MPAPEALELIRQDAERRLAGYIIRPNGTGFSLVRRCRTGETHLGSFLHREVAEAHLLAKLATGKV